MNGVHGVALAPKLGHGFITSGNTKTVKMFDLTHANPPSCTAPPCLVNPSTYITEPVEVTQSGLSPVIALQPAGATAGDPSSVVLTRPLQDNTDYAVVITDGRYQGEVEGPGDEHRVPAAAGVDAHADEDRRVAEVEADSVASRLGVEYLRERRNELLAPRADVVVRGARLADRHARGGRAEKNGARAN